MALSAPFIVSSAYQTHNNPPQEHQLPEIWSSMRQVHSELAVLDQQIESLRNNLNYLETEKAKLVECLKVHESALSPTRRLPTEIISEIFDTVLANERYDSLDTRTGPWRLAQVCRRWNEIALSWPKFWSKIDVTISEDNLNVETVVLAILSEWLTRAKTYPLRIVFYYGGDTAGSVGQSVLDELLLHSGRWVSAKLEMNMMSFMWMIQAKGRFPNLQSVFIRRLDSNRGGTTAAQSIHAFDEAPKLRHLEVHGITGVQSTFRCFPFQQLEEFNSSEYSLDILSRASQTLESCSIGTETYESERESSSSSSTVSVVVLSRCTTLTLSNGGPHQKLITPSLRTLSLQSDRRGEDALLRLDGLLTRSARHAPLNLDQLTLKVSLLRGYAIQEVFKNPSCLNLKRLNLTFYQPFAGVANQAIGALTVSATKNLLPSLENLEIHLSQPPNNNHNHNANNNNNNNGIIPHGPHPPWTAQLTTVIPHPATAGGFDTLAFVEMVESRWRAPLRVCQLHTVGFFDPDHLVTSPKTLRPLKVMRDEGLVVSLGRGVLRDAVGF